MTPTDVETIRAALEDRIAALDAAEAGSAESRATVTLDQQAVGRLSRIDAMQHQQMAFATRARRDAERTRLRAAIARLDEGEYGDCVDCGEPIAPARLNLDPATPRCRDCAG